jgi:hypothetical protein
MPLALRTTHDFSGGDRTRPTGWPVAGFVRESDSAALGSLDSDRQAEALA